jgi:hypothetical protein
MHRLKCNVCAPRCVCGRYDVFGCVSQKLIKMLDIAARVMTLAGRVSVKDLEQCEELGLTYAQLFKVCSLCMGVCVCGCGCRA